MSETGLQKQNRAISVVEILLCVTQTLNFVGYVSNAYDYTPLFSLSSRLFIIVNIISFGIFILEHFKAREKTGSYFVVFLLMLFSVIISYLANSGGIGLYNLILSFFAYLSLPMYFIYLRLLKPRRITTFFVVFFAICTALFFVFCYFFHPERTADGSLTMGYMNQNQAGMFLFQNICVLFVVLRLTKKDFYKFLLFAVIVFEIYEIYMTSSRISLLCAIILVLMMLFKNRIKFGNATVLLFVFIPVIFVIVLEIMYANGVWADLEILGKPFYSGREELYRNVFSDFLKHPIFGNYGKYQLGNAHNAYVSVLSSVGIVGFIIFIAFYLSAIFEYKREISTMIQKIAFVGILLIFLQSTAEAALMVSGSMYSAATSALLFFMTFGKKECEELNIRDGFIDRSA